MSEPFLGEIRRVAFAFPPRGWALCNGQLMAINQNQALFSLLGTVYGGDGITTFALPDLRGRTPLHPGPEFTQGEQGGEQFHTLSQSELPSHTHGAQGSSAPATAASPAGAYWAATEQAGYSTDGGGVAMNAAAVANVGGSQAHENRSPFLVVNFIIALTGIFPSRN